MNSNCWIPELEYYDSYKVEDSSKSWMIYQEAIYNIFKHDFVDSQPYFESKPVNIRKAPIEYNKEEAFFHITCQDYQKDGERMPDFRRCERIRWVRAFIENYDCDISLCDGCDGVKVWEEPYNNTKRIHLLLEEERYIVVIERRAQYYLLITAYYFDHEHALEKKLKKYEKYKTSNNC